MSNGSRVPDIHALRAEHGADRIHERLSAQPAHSYLRDAVLGGIDGCVTTFAVVAGSVGAQFSGTVIVVLGFANLLADGFSMAAGNYLGTKSQQQEIENARREENHHIDHVPAGEREEIRQIFARKGFSGKTLEDIVDGITSNRELWVNTMVTEELGLPLESPSPVRAALATFGAFVTVGLVPLLPFLVDSLADGSRFRSSAVLTGLAFFGVGVLKGRALGHSLLRSGLETLLIGGGAASVSYFVGAALRQAFGGSV
jgi:VIT1/CCC1 family predicted Fe2+/Mn2+ transporter